MKAFWSGFFASELKLFNPEHFFNWANHGTYFLLDKNGLKGPKLLQNLVVSDAQLFQFAAGLRRFQKEFFTYDGDQ